jgi:hypothetical protein
MLHKPFEISRKNNVDLWIIEKKMNKYNSFLVEGFYLKF